MEPQKLLTSLQRNFSSLTLNIGFIIANKNLDVWLAWKKQHQSKIQTKFGHYDRIQLSHQVNGAIERISCKDMWKESNRWAKHIEIFPLKIF
jgi:hypothetical protein